MPQSFLKKYWLHLCLAYLGVAGGIGAYAFVYAKGYSYITDDPRACMNCHVMKEQYDGWIKAPHRSIATCNDCHTPHSVAGKYAVKANNGFWHSYYFTTQTFKEPIEISSLGRKVALNNCRRCHEPIVEAIDGAHARERRLDCLRCHEGVGHH